MFILRVIKESCIPEPFAQRGSIRVAAKIAFLALGAPALTFGQIGDGYASRLYPGVSQEQSDLAHEALGRFHNGDFLESRELLARMDWMENRDSLPPLSRLLLAAFTVMHLQRDDAESPAERRALEKAAGQAAAEGLGRCRAPIPRGQEPTCHFIEGGILGLLATLKIPSHPTRALSDGLQALKLLERALSRDRRLQDAYMGVGLFHSTAANAPLAVRAALKVLGRSASMGKGLDALRRSSYQGQYTSAASQFFLIQFLSPYDDELRREKVQIFRSLEAAFPESPYHSFLRWHEALCFYPDSFRIPAAREAMEASLRAASPRDYASRRYRKLLKLQYALQPNPLPSLLPDTTDLKGYTFYPLFLEGLRARRDLSDSALDEASRLERIREMLAFQDSALAALENSDLGLANRRRYAWQVQDAFRPELWRPRPRPQLARPLAPADTGVE